LPGIYTSVQIGNTTIYVSEQFKDIFSKDVLPDKGLLKKWILQISPRRFKHPASTQTNVSVPFTLPALPRKKYSAYYCQVTPHCPKPVLLKKQTSGYTPAGNLEK
jgi:hypothetical protein